MTDPVLDSLAQIQNRQARAELSSLLANFRRHLSVDYPRPEWPDPSVPLLTARLLLYPDMVLHGCMVNGYVDLNLQDSSYTMPDWSYGPTYVLGLLDFFVGHEICDDGEPSLGWQCYSMRNGASKPCTSTARGARPYFCRYQQEGRSFLTADLASSCLVWHLNYCNRRMKLHAEEGSDYPAYQRPAVQYILAELVREVNPAVADTVEAEIKLHLAGESLPCELS